MRVRGTARTSTSHRAAEGDASGTRLQRPLRRRRPDHRARPARNEDDEAAHPRRRRQRPPRRRRRGHVFRPVVEDITKQLKGKPLDLYVMTHEHLDHVQGLLFASTEHGVDLNARRSWITASAEPGYYKRHPERGAQEARSRGGVPECGALPLGSAGGAADPLLPLFLNNNPERRATASATCASSRRRSRPTSIAARPGRNASVSRGEARALGARARHLDLLRLVPAGRVRAGANGSAGERLRSPTFHPATRGRQRRLLPARRDPPPRRDRQPARIDSAANNTSVVFAFEWRGWRLLFPGDAEHGSWKTMHKHGLLSTSTF